MLDDIKINQGRLLSHFARSESCKSPGEAEFRIFSQSGEDGIIQYLLGRMDVESHTFIEFGVEDFTESNCRFLLTKDFWSGFVIDGSPRNFEKMMRQDFYWRYNLKGVCHFIDRTNILSILEESGFGHHAGIISVDIDGVDYYVLETILESWSSDIIIVEYNSLFGSDRPLSVPYDPAFQRSEKSHTNLYYGANLKAFNYLLSNRGYTFVCSNRAGTNAFFVANHKLTDRLPRMPLSAAPRWSSYREGRDEKGRQTFVGQMEGRHGLATLPVVDVSTAEVLTLADILALKPK